MASATLELSEQDKKRALSKATRMATEVIDYFETKFGIRTEMPRIEVLGYPQAFYDPKEKKMYIPLRFGGIKESDISHEVFHHVQHSIGIHNWEGKGTVLQMSMSETGACIAEALYKMREGVSTVGKIVNVAEELFYESRYESLESRKMSRVESIDSAKEFYHDIRDAVLKDETPQACFHRGFELIRHGYDDQEAAYIFATNASLIIMLNKNLDQNRVIELITKDESTILNGFLKGIREEKKERIPKILDGIKELLVGQLEEVQDNRKIDNEISILKLIRGAS